MSQTRIHADTNEETAKALMAPLDQLFELEGLPVSAFEDPDDPTQWSIAVYTESEDALAVKKLLEDTAKNAGFTLKFELQKIPEIDWVAETLRELHCVRAGRFVIHGSHERHVPKLNEIAIEINAGLAFGTGHHGTTAGCLDMLTRACKKQAFHNVLDLGTGSGVLAIAAAKQMPCHVLASDIDPVATLTAKANAKLNGTTSSVECITATGFTHPRFAEQRNFDLIIANILARPLQSMAHQLVKHTAPGGTVILSGLLPHQRAPLVSTFRLQGLHLEHYHHRDGWLILVLKKPG